MIPANLLGTLIVSVTKASLDDIARYIFLILRLCKIPILLSPLLCLRVIKPWSVIELAHFLRSEKIETESHIIHFLGVSRPSMLPSLTHLQHENARGTLLSKEQIYGFLFIFAVI